MNKSTFCFVTIFAVFFGQQASAQLYVGQNTYVYVNDQYVTVNQDINLQKNVSVPANGNIYLRGEGQLLQKTTGSSANSGTGAVSVFQEGTTNNFAYNYWCSPIGDPTASGNQNFGITMLNRPNGLITSDAANMMAAPVLDSYSTGSGLYIADRWIFRYITSSLYSQWLPATSTNAMEAGQGFTMKGTMGTDGTTVLGVQNSMSPGGLGQRYDFRGRPNDGNIDITVAPGMTTLTGNPYPSAIDLKHFLTPGASPDNPTAGNCTGIAYFWEQDKTVNSHVLANYKGGYGEYSGVLDTYNPPVFYAYDNVGTQLGPTGSGTNYPRRFTPVGQGFMIKGTASGTVTMSNDFRVYQKEGGSSHFERHSASTATGNSGFLPPIPSVSGYDYTTESILPNPAIRFKTLLNNTAVREVVLAFHHAATDGMDHGMDAESIDQNTMDMYFPIENKECHIDAVNFDINKRIPVGFKCPQDSQFRIALSEMVNFDGAENVFLHDKETNMYHNIKNGDYEFSLPAGTNNTRYEITFVDNLLGAANFSADNFNVVQNNVAQTLTIANPKMETVKSVSLYDIGGKLIFSKTQLGAKGTYQFSTSGISDAVYVVKIINSNNQDFGKKITVFNGK